MNGFDFCFLSFPSVLYSVFFPILSSSLFSSPVEPDCSSARVVCFFLLRSIVSDSTTRTNYVLWHCSILNPFSSHPSSYLSLLHRPVSLSTS